MTRQSAHFAAASACSDFYSSCCAVTRYSAVTPKRADATCRMADAALSPALRFRSPANETLVPSAWTSSIGLYLRGSSLPSPQLDLAPSLFIAMARISCASLDKAPSDMPPVQKRFTISTADSTSGKSAIGSLSELKLSRSRSACGGPLSHQPDEYKTNCAWRSAEEFPFD